MNIEDKIEDLVFITRKINAMARDPNFDLCYSTHNKGRMKERDITTSEILYVLKNGIVSEYLGPGEHPEDKKVYKYRIVCSYVGDLRKAREIGVGIFVQIDNDKVPAIKIIDIHTSMHIVKRVGRKR